MMSELRSSPVNLLSGIALPLIERDRMHDSPFARVPMEMSHSFFASRSGHAHCSLHDGRLNVRTKRGCRSPELEVIANVNQSVHARFDIKVRARCVICPGQSNRWYRYCQVFTLDWNAALLSLRVRHGTHNPHESIPTSFKHKDTSKDQRN